MEQSTAADVDRLLNGLLSPDYTIRRQSIDRIKNLPSSNLQIVSALLFVQEHDENLLLRQRAKEVLHSIPHQTVLEHSPQEDIAKEILRRSQARFNNVEQNLPAGIKSQSPNYPEAPHTYAEKLGPLAYVVGGMSFIPLCGVAFGIGAMVWGLATSKRGGKILALVGGLGILSTIIIYGALFYFGFMQRGGIYDSLRAELAQTQLTQLVQSVEFYKTQNGNYPGKLETVARLPEFMG